MLTECSSTGLQFDYQLLGVPCYHATPQSADVICSWPLSYLGFLEEECAAYVTMTNIDSPVWNPVRERLLEALAQHIDGKKPQYISQKLE